MRDKKNNDRQDELLEALLACASAVLRNERFEDTARSIFDTCRSTIGAVAGYVALLTESGEENEVLFLESGGLPCAVDPSLPMPVRGLRAEAYKTGRAVYENDFSNSPWMGFMPEGHVLLKNVMFAPLNVHGKTVGLIGLANKPGDFTDRDARFAEAFGCFAALALQHSVTQRALRRSEERLSELLHSVNDVLWSTDRNGKLLYVNPAVEELYGVSARQFRRNTTLWLEAVHPEDRPITERKARALLDGRDFICEYRIVRPDGAIRWVQDRSAPVCDASGALVRMVGVTTDVTLRKEAERSRTLLQQRLKSLWRVARLVDADLKTLCTATLDELVSITASRYGFYGFMQEDGAALEVHAWSPDTEADCAVPGEMRVFAVKGGGVWTGAVRTRKPVMINSFDTAASGRAGFPAGHVTLTRLLVVPVLAQNSVAAIAAVANKDEDYTDEDIEQIRAFTANVQIIIGKKRADEEAASLREQLIQSQKMEAIGRMAGGMAHDFNNMLAVILGNASLALDELAPDAPFREEFHEIAAAARRSRELTHKLLTFARKDKLNPRTVSPSAILDGLMGMLRRSIPKNVSIHTDYHHDLEYITVDATQLEQALLNVCSNACDAMPDGGVLYIGARNRFLSGARAPGQAAGRFCEIIIRDTGTGIPQKIADKIFDPFFTTKGEGQGTGLGLAITHGIVTNHGGAISVDNAPDGGARFRIFLPATQHAEAGDIPARALHAAPDRGSETVLIVDDEPAVLTLAAKILTRAGYHVITAGSGQDAVDLVRGAPHAVDVMVLDMVMPGMDGPQVFHAVRAQRPDMPVILSSGFSAHGAAEDLLAAGAAAFTAKPYTTQELCRVVRETCDRFARHPARRSHSATSE